MLTECRSSADANCRRVYMQEYDYDCGAAVVSTLLHSQNLKIDYAELIRLLETNPDTGTDHRMMLKHLKQYPQFDIGLVKENATIEELREEINQGRLSIVAFQNGELEQVSALDSGHYGIVFAVDGEYVHLMDPSATSDWAEEEGLWSIPIAEFNTRWVDILGENSHTAIFEHWMASLSPSGMTLTNFKEGDLMHILNMDRAIFSTDLWDEETYRESIANYPTSIKFLEKDGRKIGYFYNSIYPVKMHDGSIVTAGEVASVAVLNEFRGRNLGNYLFKEAVSELKRMNAHPILIHTRVDNFPMQGVAKKQGFEIVGTIQNYYGQGEDAVQMVYKSN